MIQQFLKNANNNFKAVYKKVDWKCIGGVSVAFITTRALIVVVIYLSMIQIPVLSGAFRYNPRNLILDGLIRWDSGWYLSIINNGYSLQATPFFPLYPLLILLVSSFKGNVGSSGLWISNVSFLIALFYLYAIAKQEFDDDTASRTVFYIAAAPAAFFFSTLYTESVFLLFLAACFYYARNGKWLLAAIAGALASATRLSGVLAASFIFFEALWQQGVRFIPKPWSLQAQINYLKNGIQSLPRAWKGILASIFSTSGLIAYMVYLYQKFGDPLAFLRAEKSWNKTVSWDWPVRLFHFLMNSNSVTGNLFSGYFINPAHLLDSIFLIIFIPLVIITFLKFRPSFGVFTLLSFLLPLISGNSDSMRRYVLALIPCYLLLALWGKKPWVDRIIIGISLPLQAFLLILFSHWVFAG
jgi:Gpi18-like mannosyltransferase